jgi:drug/metabolite transporter (DMT)-like permease
LGLAELLQSASGFAYKQSSLLSTGMTVARVPSKIYLFIVLMVILGPLGNVLLGKGMKRIGATSSWNQAEVLHFLAQLSGSGVIWLGLLCLIAFFAANMLVLSLADYSYVQPASAVAYAMVALLGHFLLGEMVTPVRWAGVLVICLGVLVVGHTPPRTTEYRG